MNEIEVAGRRIGSAHRAFIIAEAGVNHNGDVMLARRLVDVAAEAGADAVKFQTFRAEKLATPRAPKADYQRQSTDPAEPQVEMLRRLELSTDAHCNLRQYCSERGLVFLSTPFDEESADFLDELGVPVFKIPSGELTNWPFLEHVARKGKPMIVSTGMSYLSEVDEAVRVIRTAGCTQLALLHCVSNYPADAADVNLRAMKTMATAFQVPVGYSDHTPGTEIALAAVALGACLIEKHFTLDRELPGPDHRASLEPQELRALVAGIRMVEAALGTGAKTPAATETNTLLVARRSLVAAVDLSRGVVLQRGMLKAIRPAGGIPPSRLADIVGRTLRRSLRAGDFIDWADLE